MNAREFRIGNKYNLFLGISDDGPQYRQVEISGINTNVLNAPRIKINNDNYWHPIENFEPIPLTEEWLLKFGFSKNENYVLQIETTLMPLSITLSDNYPNEKYKAWDYEDENFSYHIISNNIKHVHKLQNLYHALTGEELTLNN